MKTKKLSAETIKCVQIGKSAKQ